MTDCINWNGAMEGIRPARRMINGKRFAPHRLEWERHHGPIPDGECVIQTCDNLKCMNVAHMSLGNTGTRMAGADSDFETTGIIKPNGLARFWSNVIKVDGCWNWSGAVAEDGYGKTTVATKTVRAHRLSWLIHKGPIPSELQVLHKCDNPLCCNPDHLWLGTGQDNMTDKVNKGRAVGAHKGSSHHMAKLNEDSVRLARAEYESGANVSKIAQRLGVSESVMLKAVRKETWSHIE